MNRGTTISRVPFQLRDYLELNRGNGFMTVERDIRAVWRAFDAAPRRGVPRATPNPPRAHRLAVVCLFLGCILWMIHWAAGEVMLASRPTDVELTQAFLANEGHF